MYFLTGHYRQPLAFNADSLAQAQRSVERIRNLCRSLADQASGSRRRAGRRLCASEFFEALRDDFNTPEALAALFELVGAANDGSVDAAAPPRQPLTEMLPVLGLETLLEADDGVDEDAQRLAEEREQARADRDFERADEIRDELAARGYEIRDTDDGPVVVRVRS